MLLGLWGLNGARGLHSCCTSCEGQQRDVARALNGHAQPALVTRADAGHAPRQNLAAFLNELRENVGALVVDEVHPLDAKLAHLLLAEILPLAAALPPRSTWTRNPTAGASFAPPAPGTTLAAATRAPFTFP